MLTAALWLTLIAPPASADDLAVERAVEEWAMAAAHARPPEPYRSLIARMGSPRWREREDATKAMIAAGDAGRRWLWNGRMSRDPEIGMRATAAIRAMTPCVSCKGSGSSKNWELWPCGDCQGTGTAMKIGAWD